MQPLSRRIWKLVWLGILVLALTILTGGVWTVLLITNLATSPNIPWAVIVMGLLLWLIWQYLIGKGWPSKTSEERRRSLRARPLSPLVFTWACVAGLLSIAALTGFWIVLSQLVKIPGNPLPNFSKYPLVSVALVLIMASLVGAVTEEAGFRGYFQGALERETSGLTAIVIAALVMAPGHGLTQGFVWPTLMFYFFTDSMFGVMAYLTQSILPGILIHTIGLLTFFTLVWPNDAARRLVSAGGADIWFWAHIAQVLLFTTLAVLTFRHLAKLTKNLRISKQQGNTI